MGRLENRFLDRKLVSFAERRWLLAATLPLVDTLLFVADMSSAEEKKSFKQGVYIHI
jgi:hypothetical protein